jgi:hypothetical protein
MVNLILSTDVVLLNFIGLQSMITLPVTNSVLSRDHQHHLFACEQWRLALLGTMTNYHMVLWSVTHHSGSRIIDNAATNYCHRQGVLFHGIKCSIHLMIPPTVTITKASSPSSLTSTEGVNRYHSLLIALRIIFVKNGEVSCCIIWIEHHHSSTNPFGSQSLHRLILSSLYRFIGLHAIWAPSIYSSACDCLVGWFCLRQLHQCHVLSLARM